MPPQEDIYTKIGKLIRSKRQAIKPALTQEELAHRVRLKRTSITNIERGRQKLLVHTLFDIADALDEDPRDLIPLRKADVRNSEKGLKRLKPDEREFAKSVFSKGRDKSL